MLFTLRPFRRFLVQCSVMHSDGPFLKLSLVYFSGFGSPKSEGFRTIITVRNCKARLELSVCRFRVAHAVGLMPYLVDRISHDLSDPVSMVTAE